MKLSTRSFLLASVIAVAVVSSDGIGQAQNFRPPATPLITCDPYFSIWMFADHPASDWPRHWTGAVHGLCNLIRIDGKTFRAVGKSPGNVPILPLKKTAVTPTRSIYEFEAEGVGLTLTFASPLLPHDLDILGRPVSYISWRAQSLDGKEHQVSVYFDNSAELVVNTPDQSVIWSRVQLEGLDVLRIGSQEQPVLKKAGDDLRIDWGFLYSLAPSDQPGNSVITSHRAGREAFAREGTIPANDNLRMPRRANDDWPVLARTMNLGAVGVKPAQCFVALVYDDEFSIEFLQRKLRPFWRRDGSDLEELVVAAVKEFPEIVKRCEAFDRELTEDLISVGGERYAALSVLAFRQAIAAHKLAADLDGGPLFFPKENFSNGCISTVDVIYPAAPIFLLFNVELLKASIKPVLEYSLLPRWRFPYAPHDLGTYPLANGQVYGGGEKTEEYQMPVEECGNMLLLVYAASKVEGSSAFAGRYWSSLEKWARYLRDKGLDPENQICTDDFAGHLAHNANLSVKAILALGAFSRLCEMAGKRKEAEEYRKVAEAFAKEWPTLADDGDHFRLAFDRTGTWSQKYNLVWDKLLDLNLFPPEVARKEIAYYRTKQNRYGLPLDNRADYTKLDWIVWTATLAEKREDFEALISPMFDFANESESRVPMTDWYDTKTGRQVGFQARPVVGGVFIKMLDDRRLWKKWHHRASPESHLNR